MCQAADAGAYSAAAEFAEDVDPILPENAAVEFAVPAAVVSAELEEVVGMVGSAEEE